MPPANGEANRTAAAAAQARPDWSGLMARSQDGDQRAYVDLLRSVTPYLRSLARRVGTGPDDLEDSVQDILLTIHAIRHTYDPERPFGPWLVGVARHRLSDRMRKQVRIAFRETELTEWHETFVAEETNITEQASEARRLHAAVAALPAGQRQAVEMLRLKELSLKEASAATGQSETALKVAMHRAMKRLRSLLEGG